MSATNDPFVDRYKLPGVATPLQPADIANKAYVDLGGAPPTKQEAIKSANTGRTSAIYGDVPDLTLTMPNNSGFTTITATVCLSNSTAVAVHLRFNDNGVAQEGYAEEIIDINRVIMMTLCYVAPNDGQIVKLEQNSATGTLTIFGDTDLESTLEALNVN